MTAATTPRAVSQAGTARSVDEIRADFPALSRREQGQPPWPTR
jgi:hypothetical protein